MIYNDSYSTESESAEIMMVMCQRLYVRIRQIMKKGRKIGMFFEKKLEDDCFFENYTYLCI